MKGCRLHVRRKMKKIEASLIKRIMRINSQTFSNLVLEISLYCLSLLGECGILIILDKEGKRGAGKCKWTLGSTDTMAFSCRYPASCMLSSLVLECMEYKYGLLVMIYHWHGGLP